MTMIVERPYRKNLTSIGLIYMSGSEYEITIKNLSIAGVLAEFNSNDFHADIKLLFNTLLISTKHDIYLPELRLAGEAEIVRVDHDNEQILLALEFKQVTYDVDPLMHKRQESIADIKQTY